MYAAAFGLSVFSVFFSPAAASVVPALVGEAGLVGANSAVWSAAVLSQVALAPAAGALVASAGPGPAFALNAVSFLASAALLSLYRFKMQQWCLTCRFMEWFTRPGGIGW